MPIDTIVARVYATKLRVDGTADDWVTNGEGATAMRWRIGGTECGRPRILAVGLLTTLGWLACQAPQTLASKPHGVKCTQTAGVVTITIGSVHTVTITRAGDSIDLNKSHCPAEVSLARTVRIDVIGSDGRDFVRINLRGGPFVNQLGARIVFRVDLRRRWDKLGVVGTSGADSIALGARGINLAVRSGRHVDVILRRVERVIIRAGAGDDVLSADGRRGTGGTSILPGRTTFFGERGRDLLIGGNRPRFLRGMATQITCNGFCQGLPGDDVLNGGANVDTEYGLGGNDDLYGGPAHDHLDGGGGKNRCWLGKNGASHVNCTVQP